MLIKKYERLAKIVNNHNDPSQVLFSHQMKYFLTQQKIHQPHLQHGLAYPFIMTLGVISMILLLLPICCVGAVGYSYTRFVGPVSNPEHKIYVNDVNATNDRGSDLSRLDYVGKPEYEFAYGVEDAEAHVLHNRNEMRDGDAVNGVYSVIDPDGTLRVVKYKADKINGFQAEVIRNGVSSLHGQPKHNCNHGPPSKFISNNHNNFYKPDQGQHHYPQLQINLKGDRNVYYPSFNTEPPSFVQPPQINQKGDRNVYYPSFNTEPPSFVQPPQITKGDRNVYYPSFSTEPPSFVQPPQINQKGDRNVYYPSFNTEPPSFVQPPQINQKGDRNVYYPSFNTEPPSFVQPPQINLKGDRNVYYPSFNTQPPSFVQPPQINDDHNKTHNQHPASPQPSINNNKNNNHDYDYADDDDDADKNKDKDKDDSSNDNSDSDYIPDEDDENYGDENESEELEDYDETVYNNKNSGEKNNYY